MSVDWKRAINLLRKGFRNLGLPLYWHKHSPQTYQVWQHGVMLIFYRRYCRSYADFVEWLPHTKLPEFLGLKAIPDEGTLCKEEKRLRPFMEELSINAYSSVVATTLRCRSRHDRFTNKKSKFLLC